MNNNPLTYIFSTANLDAAGQRWVAHLASYNFALEYQKGKDNIVADFLSCMGEANLTCQGGCTACWYGVA